MTATATAYGFTRRPSGDMLGLIVASIGENIRSLREKAGYKSQGDFADAIGVKQPRLSDWENNRYGTPELTNLLRIAKKLNVSLDQLIRGLDLDYDSSRTARTNVIQDDVPSASSSQPSQQEVPGRAAPVAIRASEERSTLNIATHLERHASQLHKYADALSALSADIVRSATGRRPEPRPRPKAGSPEGAAPVHRGTARRGRKR